MRIHFCTLLLSATITGASATASAQAPARAPVDPATLISAQREAMKAFAKMDGVWRGPAWTILPSGEKHNVTQTERIGPLLDGSIKLVEGRSYEPDGRTGFNAFGVIAFDPATKSYSLRSHAQGRYGDFAIKPTDDGYTWEIPLGEMTIRYAATIKDTMLREVGDRIVAGKEPVRFFEMALTRVGDSSWPTAGTIAPK